MFVPPYNLILKHLGPGRSDGGPNDDLTVPRKFLDSMLRCLLEHADFDEQQYLKCNPDVAIAIRRNDMRSAQEHYIQVGYFEGRAGGTPVQEEWYLARNPDVAAAKRARKVESAEMQYRIAGAIEWRQPNPKSANDVDAWKSVLEPK